MSEEGKIISELNCLQSFDQQLPVDLKRMIPTWRNCPRVHATKMKNLFGIVKQAFDIGTGQWT